MPWKPLLGAAVCAIVGALLGAPPPAHAAEAPGPVVSLPFSTESAAGPSTAGSGTAVLNAAVAQKCNGGAALGDPQWYTLPTGDIGSVFVRGQGLYWYAAARAANLFPSSLAIVDYESGEVLRCDGEPVDVTTAHPTAIVMYFDPADLTRCTEDPGCFGVDFQMFANKTTGVPANDSWEAALPIGAAPFTGTADTSLATADGPDVLGNCLESEIEPTQANTVWWRYTATVSGALPISVDVAKFGAPRYENVVPARVGLAKLTAEGPVKVQRPLDEYGCETQEPYAVEAGATYLIGVYTRYDAYYDRPLITGAQVKLQVGTAVPPSTPASTPTPTDEPTTAPTEIPPAATEIPPAVTVTAPVVADAIVEVTAPATVPPAVKAIPRPALNRTIRITKVQYNAPGRDSRFNLNGEYLRLKNTGRRTVTLTRWTVRDGAGWTYTFPRTRLAPGTTITLFTGKGTRSSTKRYWSRTRHVWNNSGKESARLRDSYRRTVDACAWLSRPRGYTAC